ncbi:hypothetical protein ACO0LC_09315 [Undibacterium sp. JH2W]|uniref:hypothetical protein n=1 Tax=Undibacterium sp. JH2W TaxID=3413037 RepID=UPI003BF18800
MSLSFSPLLHRHQDLLWNFLHIALLPAYRHQSHGKSMMLADLDMAPEHGMQQCR